MGLEFVPPMSNEEIRARDPLGDFLVFWDEITQADLQDLEICLANATCEQDIQAFLERRPVLLAQHLTAGNGRWVIPHKRLGSEHVTDFVVGECNSLGTFWTAVELESPSAVLFTKAGDPSAILSHAVRQIQDWRVWLTSNRDYAARPRKEDGLGLDDVDGRIPGLILIGRRANLDPETTRRRRQMSLDLNIQIHTYDWLIDRIRERANVNDPPQRDALPSS